MPWVARQRLPAGLAGLAGLAAGLLRVAVALQVAACAQGGAARMDLGAQLAEPLASLQQGVTSEVTSVAGSYVRAQAVDYEAPGRGSVNIRVVRAPLESLLHGMAREAGFALVLAEGVDGQRLVTADLAGLEFDPAVKELAFIAGYAAILDHATHTLTLADQATSTYRLPPHLLQRLLTQYSVSSHPGGAAQNGTGQTGTGQVGAGQSAAAGSAASATQGLTAEFGVQMRQEHDAEQFRRFIVSLAGGPAQVSVLPDSGLLTVRAQAQALRRVSGFLEQYVKDAGAQVELQVSLLEVTLGNQFQFGIDWSRVIGLRGLLGAGANANLQIANGQVVNSPSLTTTVTTQTTTAVIKALEQYTRVQVLSQPRLLALNHSPAILHDGTQVPYLGTVTSTVTGTAGTTSNSGAVSYALDGISLAFRPDILDQQLVQLSVIPVLSSVGAFQTFNLGNGAQLNVPSQPVRQAHLQVIVEAGKTVIVGGTRAVNESGTVSGVPGTADLPFFGKLTNGYNDGRSRKELVMLIHANILPARPYRFLVSETL